MTLTREERLARQRAYNRLYREKNREKLAARNREWRENNAEKLRDDNRRWRRENPKKTRANGKRHRDKNPGKTRDRYQNYQPKRHPGRETVLRRRERQEQEAGRPRPDRCEICGGNKGGIAFDHCHKRGIFRGWICACCNTALAVVNDDPNRLRMLIAYLERTSKLIPPQLVLPF